MFGFVSAHQETLSEEQLARYRRTYCGLCHVLGEKYGYAGRLTLTYDMTFLILLLESLYEPEESEGVARCLPHPFKAHRYVRSRFTEYAADLNLLLAYYNCEDDWQDDKNLLKHGEALLIKKHIHTLLLKYPRQGNAVVENLNLLQQAEQRQAAIDEPMNCFAALMGELFVPDEADHWASALRKIGEALGRFIYLLDAYIDIDDDLKHGSYTPLADWKNDERFDERCLELLKNLVGEAAIAMEALPLIQDLDILRNILYSGVWTKFSLAWRKRQKEQTRQ